MSGADEKEESFAALIGETKPIDRGPARVEPPRRTRRPGDVGATGRRSAEAFRWPDPEVRHRAAAAGVSDAQLIALGRGEPEPEERIDLHGARRKTAGRLLASRIESARQRGLRCLIVIHGRGRGSATGEAVLRDALPDWLTTRPCAPHVLAFAPAPDRLGGEGATLVLLRRS